MILGLEIKKRINSLLRELDTTAYEGGSRRVYLENVLNRIKPFCEVIESETPAQLSSIRYNYQQSGFDTRTRVQDLTVIDRQLRQYEAEITDNYDPNNHRQSVPRRNDINQFGNRL